MGEAVLSAFLQVFFDRLPLEEYVRDFIRGCNMEKEVEKLGRTLRNVTSFLNDAENKQYQKKPVKEWLDNLRDAVYDAEDLIDDVTTEALRKKLKSEFQTSSSQVSRFFLPISKFKFEKFKKIKAITRRFEELERERSQLGLEEIASGSSSSNVFRETSSVVDESSIFGRETDKANIIDLVLKKGSTGIDNEICIIPIVGMGGMGKTTLTQIVYNDTRVENCFDVKAWVCVSDEFDIKRITKAILKSVTSTPCEDDLNSLQVGLKNALNGKKFLIVLDDVWNKNYANWDVLRKPFGVGAPGSAIIVTTRDGDIGSNMGTVNNYFLEKLSEHDCWSVFVQHAFGIRTVDANPNFKEIGLKIVRKCNGLPLAAKSLGGLLRSKEESKWENVLNSKIWELKEEENGILPVLKLSYYYLPSDLKRCFAYCSIFPKDYEFEEDNLVLLWMAEGFLQQPNGNMELEDFGHMCFRELLSRSFFQPSTSVNRRFVMHDLMNDLALWAAGETCFRLEDSLITSTQCKISRKARHSSYITGQYDGVRKFKAYYEIDYLRTFLPLKGYDHGAYLTRNVIIDLSPKLKFLRVLSLGEYYGITELPGSIGELKHLRYLDLSKAQIKSLPESVCTLYNLQTLLLKYCSRLEKLPEDLQKLINLRHLSLADRIEGMPPRVGRLTSLRGLSDFVVGEDSTGKGIGELMNLKHLQGLLRISKLENVVNTQQARDANLCDKKGLNVLEMEWCFKFDERRDARVEKEVLDKLRPHKNLKELTIKCYGGMSFPTWIGDPDFTNMAILKLEGCERCTDLPPLGQLSMLKDLFIGGMNGVVSVGTGFYGEGCSNPFPSLETLCFQNMPEWTEWLPSDVEKCDNLFACLRELSLIRCPNLSGSIPDHLPFLEKLKVYDCERLTVSISKLPKLCKLDIIECKEVAQRIADNDMSLLKSVALEKIAKVTFLTDGFIQGSTKVDDLEIASCDELVSLWQKEKNVSLLQHLTLLHKLVIRGCKNLENLEGLQNLTSLRELRIVWCPLLVSLPERGLTLQKLEITDCNALKSVSEAKWHNCNNSSLGELSIKRCDSLTSIARASLFSTVKQLSIGRCSNLQSLLNNEDDDDDDASSSSSSSPLPSLLETLIIEDCKSLTSLFSSSSSSRGESSTPATLKRLEINYCPKLESIGEFNLQHNNTSLESIYIYYCESLKSLPENLHNLTRLLKVSIYHCKSLVRFPDGGLPPANLRILNICGCEKLEALPDRMHDLTSLEELGITYCPGIEVEEVCFPTNNIKSLTIEGPTSNIWKQLLEWWGGLNRLTSLTSLYIFGRSSSLDIVSFPADKEESSGSSSSSRMVLPSSLITLGIFDFPNLERLSSKGFQNLTSLEHLSIFGCPKLQSFPKKGLFPSLLRLSIVGCCPLLKQRCKRDQGKEWPTISHVPCIEIDRHVI